MQRLFDQLVAILQQIGAKLPTCPRQTMQRVQIQLAGKLFDNTVALIWLAGIGRGAKSLFRFRLTDNSSGRLKIH
jgi:hypothetical protein